MSSRKKRIQMWSLAIIFLMLVGCNGVQAEPTAIPSATPSQAELRITKYPGNYTSFKLETAEGLTIITDPFDMDEDVQPDIVTTSHSDLDHRDFSRLQGKYQLINTVGNFTPEEIKITGVAGHHNKGDPMTTNIIYVFDIDGLRLAQFASQGEMPTEAMFAEIGNVDILIIQIYGVENGKLSVEEASQIVQRLHAKIVIPAHTDTSLTDNFASLVMGGKSEKVTSGKLKVSLADLAGQQTSRVIVLDVPEK